MFQLSVPCGSPRLANLRSGRFALHWQAQLASQCSELDDDHQAVLQKLNQSLCALNGGDATHILMACRIASDEARAHSANFIASQGR